MIYKVLTQSDKFFGGKFNAEKLEEAINAYAKEGWIVKAITTADIPSGFGKVRQELIVVFESTASS